MSNPKRKVTDLLPTEAILISCDADLKVLYEFEKAGAMWIDGSFATDFILGKDFFNLPICLFLRKNNLAYSDDFSEFTTIPATDFIPTESDEVEVSDNKIDWYKKLLAKLKRIESGELSLSEYIEQVELKTRNTPNQ